MKSRNILGFSSLSRIYSTPIFIVFVAVFICGAIAGSITGQISALADGSIIQALAEQLTNQAKLVPTFTEGLKSGMGAFAWQILIIFLGMLRPAGLFICIALTIRGFILAFSTSALFGALGSKGIFISLFSSGMSAVITIPCLIVTAVACYVSAKQAPKGKKLGYFYVLRSQRGVLLICTIISIWISTLRLPFAYAISHLFA